MLNLGTNSKNVWLAGWAGWLAPFASCLSLSLSLLPPRSVSPWLRYLALPCVTVGTTETDESDGRRVRRTEYRSIGVTDSLYLPLRNVYTSTVHTYLLQDVARRYYYHCHYHYCTIYRTRTELRCTALHYVLRYSTVQYTLYSPSLQDRYPADSAILQTQSRRRLHKQNLKDKKKNGC